MHVSRSRLASLTAVILVPVIGCAPSGTGDFRPYDQLETVSPSDRETDTATIVPTDDKTRGTDPTAVATIPADEQPAVAEPAASFAGVAVAELPVRLLMERTPAAAILDSASTNAGPDGVAVAELPETITVVAASPRKVELLIPEKKFRKTAGALQISYDDLDLLKVLNMEPVTPDAPSLMPSWLKELNGQRVRVRGFMYPAYSDTLTKFVLARDNQICCFGRNPKIYDLIEVTMREGETTHYIENRPFDVVGVFRIKPSSDDERLFQLYFIEDAVVIER